MRGAPAPFAATLRSRVLVIAHRGASHDAPEHTHAAYALAVSEGTDFLEADLRLTRDRRLVCLHDGSIDRTGSGSGPVGDFTLEELRQFDFGAWFNRERPDRARPEFEDQRIVAFEEQLDTYLPRQPGLRFHVETKTDGLDGAVRDQGVMETELVRVLSQRGLLDPDPASAPVVVQSFDAASLERLHALTGDGVPTALLSPGPPPERLPAGVDIAAPHHLALLAQPGRVDALHESGIEVHTWTVDDPATMRSLVALGVDGIFTNRPGLMRRVLREFEAEAG